MTSSTTWADITVNTVWDGDIVTQREIIAPAAGEHAEIIRLTMRSGGRRTEFGSVRLDDPVLGADTRNLRIADPTLVDVTMEHLDQFVDAVNSGIGIVPVGWQVTALHGVALEYNRRRALDCIERGCSKADAGCICHTLPAARRFRRK